MAPRFVTGGLLSVLVGDRGASRQFVGTPSVDGHIWGVLESVNGFLQFYFKAPQTRRNLPVLGPLVLSAVPNLAD